MSATLLIVTDGLISAQDGVLLHPELLSWQAQLDRRKQHWFNCEPRTALQWYGELLGTSATEIVAAAMNVDLSQATQFWSVYPYHARLARDAVQVAAEGDFPWRASDASWLCDMLNPLLVEEGMRLHCSGSAMLLSCSTAIDAEPLSFAAVAGSHMPGCHHRGADGGRLNRLLSEIQMLLHGNQSPARRECGEPDLHGLWLCDPVAAPLQRVDHTIAVATRSPQLTAVVDGRDSRVIITESARAGELLKADAELPVRVLLCGCDHALLLSRSMLPRLKRRAWQPRRVQAQGKLLELIRSEI